MKKIYLEPTIEVIEQIENALLIGDSGEVDPEEGAMGKENHLIWDDNNDSYELWGDDSSDEDWLNDNNN